MQDFDIESQLAQQRYQQALAEQNRPLSSPQGKMVGNIYVRSNPLEALISGLRIKQSKDELTASKQELKDVQGKRQLAIANALRDFESKSQGTPGFQAAGPAQPGPQTADPLGLEGGQAAPGGGYQVPARAPDMRGAYASLMNAPDASLRQAGMQGMIQIPQMEAAREERLANREFRQNEAEANRQARMEQIKLAHDQRMELMQSQNATRAQMAQEQREFQRQMAQMQMANRPERQAQIIQTDQGPMQLVGGQAVPIMGADGRPVGPTKTPEALQRVNDANAALATIQQAEQLIPKATGSYAGAGIDQAARLIGMSTPGARSAAQLKALEGDLVSKMPKMSGPQSDKDVQLYRQMAGQIGDPTIPNETKMAALATIKEIQGRYAGKQQAAPAPARQLTGQDAAAMQWAQQNPNDPRSKAILQRLGQ